MIGIFDSGAGGLSVYREIVKLLPEQSYVYYSDNANCPYGEKSPEFIIERSRWITNHLLSKGCKIIVIACNTATAAAIATLRSEFPDTPFIGMEPAVKPAALNTRTKVIGVLATAGTLKASKYLDTRDRFADGIKVVEHVGSGFVELVESGQTRGSYAEEIVRESVVPLIGAGADIIVLGCTHYPFLRPLIEKICGPDVEIIDPAPAAARHLVDVMRENGIPMSSPGGFRIILEASGDGSTLHGLYSRL